MFEMRYLIDLLLYRKDLQACKAFLLGRDDSSLATFTVSLIERFLQQQIQGSSAVCLRLHAFQSSLIQDQQRYLLNCFDLRSIYLSILMVQPMHLAFKVMKSTKQWSSSAPNYLSYSIVLKQERAKDSRMHECEIRHLVLNFHRTSYCQICWLFAISPLVCA